MRSILWMSCAGVAVLLSACADQGSQSRTAGGQVVGSAERRNISPGESPVSIDGGNALGAIYSQRAFQTRTTTNIEMSGGSIIYEASGTTEMFGMVGDTSIRIIDSMIAPHLSRQGMSANRNELTRVRARIGTYAMVPASGNGRHCWMFQVYPDSSAWHADNGGFYRSYLAGYFCGTSNESASVVEAATRRLFEALHLDGGAINRSQARSAPSQPAPASPSAIQQQPPNSPAQSLPQQPNQRDAETRIRELNRLRDGGLITPQEYEARRRAILEAL